MVYKATPSSLFQQRRRDPRMLLSLVACGVVLVLRHYDVFEVSGAPEDTEIKNATRGAVNSTTLALVPEDSNAASVGNTSSSAKQKSSSLDESSPAQQQQQVEEGGHWIPVPENERLDYMEKEKMVCGQPFQHCCVGQCRQLPSRHSNSSELFVKWSQPVAKLPSVLTYMGKHNIPCNLWFVGFSLTGDHAVGAMCELMRKGYKLKDSCIPYANERWGEANVSCSSRIEPDGHPQTYYELENPSRKECPSVTIGVSGNSRPPEAHNYVKRGGVMIWNYGVHCDKREDCIENTMETTLAKFSMSAEADQWSILWRETEHQHFNTKNGYHIMSKSKKGPCEPIQEMDDWRNEEARKFLERNSMNRTVPIIPVAKASEHLHFMHAMDVERGTYDCTHYCYSPWRLHVTWDGILRGLKQLRSVSAVGERPSELFSTEEATR